MYDALLSFVGYDKNLHYRDRIMYFINLCCAMLGLLFLVFYVVLLKFMPAIIGISLYCLGAIYVFYLLKQRKFRLAKFVLIGTFLLQETSIVFILFPHEVHFNLYYYIIAPITFFVYDRDVKEERRWIYIFNALAVILYMVSELGLKSPFVYIPDENIIYLFTWTSAFTSIMSITYVFHVFSKEISDVYSELSKQATTDGLTHIKNRRFLFHSGRDAFNQSIVSKETFVLIVLDIDHFKRINDTYGHPTGDSVLIQLVNLIRNQIRKDDVFSRYGGEEFAVLLKDTDLADGIKRAERIRKSVEETTFTTCDLDQLTLTVSMGVVQSESKFGSFENMVQSADKALYTAKNNGRNLVIAVESH